MNKIEISIHAPIVYRYYDYLKENCLGKQNGIARDTLASIMGTQLADQKKVLQAINTSPSLPRIISTCSKIYMCDSEQECVIAFMNEIKSGLTRLQKGKKMAQKVGLHNQYKIKLGEYYKDLINVFEDKK